MSVLQGQIPVFKGLSYEYWSTKMQRIFQSQDLWSVVESDINGESSERVEHQAVDEALFSKIAESKVAREAWLPLKSNDGEASLITERL